jgi:hypothetical protein
MPERLHHAFIHTIHHLHRFSPLNHPARIHDLRKFVTAFMRIHDAFAVRSLITSFYSFAMTFNGPKTANAAFRTSVT